MATDSSIALPPDSTGKKLRTTQVATTPGNVEQQVVNIGDPTVAASLMAVLSDGSITARMRDNTGASLTSVGISGHQSLDVNLAGSGAGSTSGGTISAAVGNTPGTAVTASTTAQIVASVAQAGNITFHLVATAFVGTLVFEASVDAGFNYSPVMCIREDGTGNETGTSLSVAAAFIRQYTAGLPGLQYFRVRCTAYTSGTVAVLLAPGPFLVEPNPALAASTATVGAVAPVDGFKATYTAGTSLLNANIAGDLFVVSGSATKTVRITRVDVSVTGGGTITSVGSVISVQKRTTASTGGTAGAAVTTGPVDSTSAAPTATATQYTAAPTSGALASYLRAVRWQQAVTSASWSWDFGDRPSMAPVLRGTAQQLAINNSIVATGTSPALNWTISVEWTEE